MIIKNKFTNLCILFEWKEWKLDKFEFSSFDTFGKYEGKFRNESDDE